MNDRTLTLQPCYAARLQDIKITTLQNGNIATLPVDRFECSLQVDLETLKYVMHVPTQLQTTDGWTEKGTGKLLELLSQLKTHPTKKDDSVNF